MFSLEPRSQEWCGAAKKNPAEQGTLRELDQLPNLPRSHDATVKQTFDKWLPQLLPAAP